MYTHVKCLKSIGDDINNWCIEGKTYKIIEGDGIHFDVEMEKCFYDNEMTNIIVIHIDDENFKFI